MPRVLLTFIYGLVLLAVTPAEAAAQFPLPLNPEAQGSHRIKIAPCFWNGVQRPRDPGLLGNAQRAADLWRSWIPSLGNTYTARWLELPDTQSGPDWTAAFARGVAEACLAAHGGVEARENVLVMLHPALDLKGRPEAGWSVAGTVESRRGDTNVLKHGIGSIAHEIGHGFSLAHSAGWAWSLRRPAPLPGIPRWTLLRNGTLSTNVGTNPNYAWEYGDNGDIMGDNARRLNPYNRERLGLTAIGSVLDHWSRGSNGRYRLCDERGTTDIARVPLDRGDPNKYLLLEYRAQRDGAGLVQGDGNLNIYIVDERTGYADEWGTQGPDRLGTARRSILLREQNGVDSIVGSPSGDVYYSLGDPLQGAEVARGGDFTVRVRRVGNVQNLKPDTQCRDVEVEGVPRDLTPETCAEGFVWREATPADKVCVSPRRRDAVARANASGTRAPGRGACPSGLSRREAVPRSSGELGDNLCVSSAERNLVMQENAEAYSRTFRAQASGPWSCKPGFVWRQANRYDRVCVTPAAAREVATQNRVRPIPLRTCAEAPSSGRLPAPRRPSFDGDDAYAPLSNFRNAWPGDTRCVTAAEAALVSAQNAAARNNWLWSGV